MKTYRKLIGGLLALALIAAPAVAQAQVYWWWQVIDQRGRPYPSQAVRCSVYDWPSISHSTAAGIGGNKVLHQNAQLNAAGNEPGSTMPLLSDANSRLHFWTSSTGTQIKVLCYYDRGGAATDVVLERTVHQVMIDREGRKVVRFQITGGATATRTGIWFGRGDVIRDVLVNVTSGPYGSVQPSTPDTGATGGQTPHLNVGFAGAHTLSTLGLSAWGINNTSSGGSTGFTSPPNSVLVHAMGLTSDSARTQEWIRPHVQMTLAGTAGAIASYLFVANSHRGIALAITQTGRSCTTSMSLAVGCHYGSYFEVPYTVPTDLEVTYTTTTSPGLSGHVYIFFDQMHTGSAYGPASGFTTVP